MASIALLQARTNSTRLPAKVLLPIREIPLVILAVKRAANTGRKVCIVTSSEESDDALAAIVESNGVRCFRGSLDDTLERFVTAMSDYDDDTVVFRLTGDNVFPDGNLLDEMEQDFISRELDYLCCIGEQSGLPYGMSAEVTRVKHLREAHRETQSNFDREHVTPYIIRKFGRHYFRKYQHLHKENYRCTVDCLDDYLSLLQVFQNVPDPFTEPAFSLVDRLERLSTRPVVSKSANQLVIGGAQLGLAYGIANQTGQPAGDEAEILLKTAIRSGVEYIDTASGYGSSEEIIGQALRQGWDSRVKVITKLSPLTHCPADATQKVVEAFVEASIYRSCTLLRRKTLDCLMLHRFEHLEAWSGAAWLRIVSMHEQGILSSLGVSVQTPNELFKALQEPRFTIIQLPFNIVDGRWQVAIERLVSVKAERDLTIHVRSSFLQGLLLTNDTTLWHRANCAESQPVIDWLQNQVAICDRTGVVDLCLAYVRSQRWVDGVVVGMELASQLQENLQLFSSPEMTDKQLSVVNDTRVHLTEMTLNPAKWQSE